jgi:hypothetical protein
MAEKSQNRAEIAAWAVLNSAVRALRNRAMFRLMARLAGTNRNNDAFSRCLSRLNCAGSDLFMSNLRSVDLSEANLEGCNLAGADFVDADLTGACLDGTQIDRTHFDRARLDGASFIKARILESHFDGAHFEGTTVSAAEIDSATRSRLGVPEARQKKRENIHPRRELTRIAEGVLTTEETGGSSSSQKIVFRGSLDPTHSRRS